MVGTIVVLAAAVAAGFGLGRVKNAAKLAAIKTEIANLEAKGEAEVAKVIAAIKSHL